MNCTPHLIGPHRCARFAPDAWALLNDHGAVVGWFAELSDLVRAVGGHGAG